jgi:PAS domain S-box-containing protein
MPVVLAVVLGDLAVEVFVVGSLQTAFEGAALLRVGASVVVGVLVVYLFYAASTGRERADAEIARIAAQRQLALDAARLGWWHYDPITRVTSWDDRYRQILGVTGYERANHEVLSELIHPEDQRGLWAKVEAALDPTDPKPFAAEYRIKQPDGMTRWIEAHGVATFEEVDGKRRAVSFVGTVADVTEQKEAEHALRQSREDLARAQEVGQIGWWRLDTVRNVLVWSDELHRIFGVPKGTPMTYETFMETVHPDDRGYVDTKWQAGLRGEGYNIEHRIVVDGRVKWVREKAYLERDDAGQVVGGFGIAQDITDRRLATEALRESEAFLRLAQASAGAGVWSWDLSTDKMEWSDELFLLFGLDPAKVEPTFDTWSRLVHPDDRQAAEKRVEKAIANRTPLANDYRIVLPSGVVRWIDALGNTTYDDEGKPLRMSGICIDVTQRARAEEQLRTERKRVEEAMRLGEEQRKVTEAVRAERQRFYNVLDTLPVYVALLSPDHHVPFSNRFFRERFGESNGRRCYEHLFNREEPCEVCESFKVFKTGEPHRWPWTGPDNRDYDIFDHAFTDADGSPLVLEMGIDITDRKRAEKELQAALEDSAARATQLRALASELTLSEQRERTRLAKVLHDHLQQLLIAAKFRAEIMGRSRDEVTREAAAEIERLLESSISASRSLTSELSPPILREGALPACLEWLARWMADRYGLKVDLAIEERLPPLAQDVKVLLFESVRELLFNTVKHAHVIAARISVDRVDNEGMRITVSDNGTGFDPGELKRAGEIGGGFGLFSIRERLDLLGGRMEIDSAPGCGSRFILTAPLGQSVVMAPGERAFSDGSPKPGVPIRVLLADDHAVVREGLRGMLGEEPDIVVVGEAAHGLEAVELAGQLHPDVILMDVNLPKLNGVEATRVIHGAHPEVRVIGLSMFEDGERVQDMRDAGAVDYVTKSAPSSDLLAAIRRAAGGH